MIPVAFGMILDHADEHAYRGDARSNERPRRGLALLAGRLDRSCALQRRKNYRIAQRHLNGLRAESRAGDFPWPDRAA